MNIPKKFEKQAIKLLDSLLIGNVDASEQIINQWLTDYKHGISHSYWVYKQAQNIRDKESWSVDNHSLFIRAILHDLGDFLPESTLTQENLTLIDGLPKATAHAEKIARFISIY